MAMDLKDPNGQIVAQYIKTCVNKNKRFKQIPGKSSNKFRKIIIIAFWYTHKI